MAWYHYILATLFAFVAIILMGVILLQRGKGVGLSGAFGGAGGHTAFGAKTGDVLTWATIIIAILLLTFAVILNYVFVPPTPFAAPPPPTGLPTLPPMSPSAPGTQMPTPVPEETLPPAGPAPTTPADTAPPPDAEAPVETAPPPKTDSPVESEGAPEGTWNPGDPGARARYVRQGGLTTPRG
jgi:preprotein translocase subunit SecG